jgi:Ni/Fe-hydrogenase subunit HybB-like protein
VVWRFAMLAAEGRLGYAFGAPWIGPSGNAQTFQIPFFWLEMALFVVSGAMYLVPAVRANRGRLFLAAFLGILAGAAYRVNTYLTAYDPGIGWRYFPSVGEIVVTVGLASLGLAGFVLIVKKLPILALGHEGSKH